MNILDRVSIVGTSHVAKESKTKILAEFAKFKPDIIGIELDRQRFQGLMSKQPSSLRITLIRQIGLTGYLFAVIGRFIQKKIGNLVGMNPGTEMLLGANLAKNNKLMLALIDQDVSITLKNMSKKVKFSEKMKILRDIVFAPFEKKEKVYIDLNKVPSSEVIIKLLNQMKGSYPGFYDVLVEDRNKIMAKKIFTLLVKNPDKKILVIIGAGHQEGINRHLKSLEASNVQL